MILYLDTSALVKRYVREEGSDAVVSLWESAEHLATSYVAHAECLTAFGRKRREASATRAVLDEVIDRFLEEWQGFIRVEVNRGLEPYVVGLVRKHPLRGFDAIHLASALLLHERLTEETGARIVFACYDANLVRAARAEGLKVHPERT